jgi:hypothetical protein
MPFEGPPGCPEDSPILLVCRIEGPATGLAASPPRSGFRRLFASRALSRRGARPTFGSDGSSPKDEVWAGRRSSTSAIVTFREHDHGPSEPRSTARTVARALSFSRTSLVALATRALPGCGWPSLLSGVALSRAAVRTLPSPDLLAQAERGCRSRMLASRDVTGQGPYTNPRERKLPAPSVAIARAGSFAPTRSARAPPVASSMLPAVESVRGAGALSAPSVSEFELTRVTGRLRGPSPSRAASHDLPRRRSCSAAPEVLSVVRSAPRWEPWLGPQPVPRLWSPGRRLCDPRAGLDP